jgi:hypothetical protein
MPDIYRQKPTSELTPAQQEQKLQKDAEYEQNVHSLSDPFYQKKHTAGVTPQEEAEYRQARDKLWDDYYSWAIANGLYERVTVEQQLNEENGKLKEQLDVVNQLRAERGYKPIGLVE